MPKEWKEISVPVLDIPGLEVTRVSQRRRVPKLDWTAGTHRLRYLLDGTLIGLAGMGEESFTSRVAKNTPRRRGAQQQTTKKKHKTASRTEEEVVELGERRSFEFREDDRGCVWGKDEVTGKERQIYMPRETSEVIEGVVVNEESETQLRKGISNEVFTVIEFELEAGGIKEPEKIQTPGSLRGVVMTCGDGNCMQITVGDETKMVGMNGSFVVESETEWMIHNKHKSIKAVVLLILIADFVTPDD
jgi:hypothetical protein